MCLPACGGVPPRQDEVLREVSRQNLEVCQPTAPNEGGLPHQKMFPQVQQRQNVGVHQISLLYPSDGGLHQNGVPNYNRDSLMLRRTETLFPYL